MMPLYTTIFPPGPQLAFSSSLLIRFTSQAHWAESGRNVGAWAISRSAIACTRCAWLLVLSSTPFVDASVRVCWYDCAYIWFTWAVDSMLNMYCLRSTPTASPLVVLTAWQAASSRLVLRPRMTNGLRIGSSPVFYRGPMLAAPYQSRHIAPVRIRGIG